MGLYSDLQSDLQQAFNGDLADAVTPLQIIEDDVAVYDPATGGTTANSITYDTRCVVLSDVVGQDPDDPIRTSAVKLLVLDSEKKVGAFVIGMVLHVRNSKYEIEGHKIDPANSTHTLLCRRS